MSDFANNLSAIGTLAGGAGGLAGGLIGAWQSNKARQNARKAINNWNKKASDVLDEYEGQQVNFSSPDDLRKYEELKANFNPNDFVFNFDQFDNSKYNVDDYVNQNKDRIIADVGKGVQATAAGAGLGHSAGTLQNIIDAQTAKSEELYNNAYNRMNTERNFDYQQYQNYINSMQNKLNQQYQMTRDQMNQYKGDIEFDQNQNAQNVQNRLSLGNSIAQAKASLV